MPRSMEAAATNSFQQQPKTNPAVVSGHNTNHQHGIANPFTPIPAIVTSHPLSGSQTVPLNSFSQSNSSSLVNQSSNNFPNKSDNSSNSSSVVNWNSDAKNFRIQGWDPILIIVQILAIQALHYLTLSVITPPLLALFAQPLPLDYEGGPANVAMIMDWREMAGYGTLHQSHNLLGTWAVYGKLPEKLGRKPSRLGQAQSHTKIKHLKRQVESNQHTEEPKRPSNDHMTVDIAADPKRRWILSAAWFMSSMIGVLWLYYIVRKPIHIMDHSLTICLNHLILTSYYSSSLPTSIWFYFILIFSSIIQIIWSENLCVKREMRDGLGIGWKVDHRPEDLPKIKTILNHHHHYEQISDNND
ncbi:hypothetical protein O181_005291 [Austropuccinia psidii MF-1]|uniref:Uncharacterized protein n=1 Tax=Austropuccinia psidii MF-1 TaxID=1389203 RepID=A0A9Q3BIK3_9BASI|nr:hypothetical protein [Austropuccinia psidii MF-1]